jgi:teichuronic acid biosynthesis protein TuaE
VSTSASDVTTTGPAPARPASAALQAALLAAAALTTVLFAVGFARAPLLSLATLALIALGAVVVLGRRRLAEVSMSRAVWVLLLLIPLTALLGPVLALPAFPQLFAFRIVAVIAAYLVLTLLLVARPALRFGAGTFALLFALWYGWLVVSLVWAPDKLEGLRYLTVVGSMLVLMAAMAAAGRSDRSLRALCWVLAAGFVLVVGFSLLESRLGIRLPTSRLLEGKANQQYAVTSVFHNQNDLATFIAISWPFLLAPWFLTRRLLWRALSLAGMGMGLFALLHTGSRSSLLAIALETLVLVVWFGRLGTRLGSRRGRVVGALLAVVLIAGAGYLLFNNSTSTMLRQFRLEALLANVQSGQGSGDIRVGLLRHGLGAVGRFYLLGTGPGNAEVVLRSGLDSLGLANLHNWWLEVLVNGGLPAACLQALIFFGLAAALWRVARAGRDPLTTYLAIAGFAAFAGLILAALGPSSSAGFAPLWMLWGLALAVVSRDRLRAEDEAIEGGEAGAARPQAPAALSPGAVPQP